MTVVVAVETVRGIDHEPAAPCPVDDETTTPCWSVQATQTLPVVSSTASAGQKLFKRVNGAAWKTFATVQVWPPSAERAT